MCCGTESFLAINAKLSPEKQQRAQDFLWWLYSSETGKSFVIEKLNFIDVEFESCEKYKNRIDSIILKLRHACICDSYAYWFE